MNESEARNALIDTCRRLYDRNLTVSAGGNMSVRLNDNEILITPSGTNKGLIQPDDLTIVTMEGKVVSGRKPSIETGFHLALYENPETNAVLHCHPLHCVAVTTRGESLRCNLTPEGALLLGNVPIIPYITPGTPELVEAVRKNKGSKAMLLARHGATTQGRTLEEAYNRMEELEFQARLQLLCADAEDLPAEELRKLGVL